MVLTKRDEKRLADLESRFGHAFSNRNLLIEALTHASAAGRFEPDNQRLEFLGDRVLGLVVAEALIERFPNETEGRLAPRLNALVRRETCAEVATQLALGDELRMARSEANTGGRKKLALLADAMEAVVAAVYLDGGLKAASSFIVTHWGERLDRQAEAPIDAKTALQEWAQGLGLPVPRYELIERSGPDHQPRFLIEAVLSDGRRARGEGSAKRSAEQAAAAALMTQVANDD